MSVIELFDPDTLDIIVLTSYPHSVSSVNRPSDIPLDYYSSITELLPGKPLGFSEVTWPSTDAFGGEQAQAEFIPILAYALTQEQGIDLEFIMWSWLHDLGPGDDTGLIGNDSDEKMGYSAWLDLSNR